MKVSNLPYQQCTSSVMSDKSSHSSRTKLPWTGPPIIRLNVLFVFWDRWCWRWIECVNLHQSFPKEFASYFLQCLCLSLERYFQHYRTRDWSKYRHIALQSTLSLLSYWYRSCTFGFTKEIVICDSLNHRHGLKKQADPTSMESRGSIQS